jgi:hypothetical protein
MNKPKTKYQHWTKELCRNEAIKYTYKVDFKKNSVSAYSTACKNNWIQDICSHMEPKRDIWTKEKCHNEAKKYSVYIDFELCSRNAYAAAYYHGWLNDICSHMIRSNHIKWDKLEVLNEALKYTTKNEFSKKSHGAYHSAWKNGFLQEACQHMDILGNKNLRCIYSVEFVGTYAYVGLTYNFKKRISSHFTNPNSAVFQHIKNFGHQPTIKQLTKYIDVKDAAQSERYYVEEYKKLGCNVLNKITAGGTGGRCKRKNNKEEKI